MRIGMILDKPFPPDPRVANEARSLVRAGHEVVLLCLRFDDTTPREEVWEGVRLRRVRMGRGFYKKASALALSAPFYFDAWRRALRTFASDERLDALHVHDLPLLRVGLEAARGARIPLVADLHENYPAAVAGYAYANRFPGRLLISPARWRRYEEQWLAQADRIIVVVEEAAERLRDAGIPGARVSVVSNTVDVDEFEGFPRDAALEARISAHFSAVYLGGFDRHRGLDTALAATKLLSRDDPEFRLILVGDGATRSELETESRRLGLIDRVSFEGYQSFARFPSYVAGARVALIPHRRSEHTDTTIPHKLFHYMLLERPVVASDCRPLERILRETQAGSVFRSGSPEDLARAISVYRDPTLAAETGRRGRRAVIERFNWERSAATLLELYAGLGD